MLVTVVTPTGKVLPLGGLLVTLWIAQLSVAVTVKMTLLRPHWPGSAVNTMLLGQVRTGFSRSTTVTVKEQLFVLPLESVAVLVTVVTPIGNVLPLGGVLAKLVTLQSSVAMTLKLTTAEHAPGAALTTRLVGQMICGDV